LQIHQEENNGSDLQETGCQVRLHQLVFLTCNTVVSRRSWRLNVLARLGLKSLGKWNVLVSPRSWGFNISVLSRSWRLTVSVLLLSLVDIPGLFYNKGLPAVIMSQQSISNIYNITIIAQQTTLSCCMQHTHNADSHHWDSVSTRHSIYNKWTWKTSVKWSRARLLLTATMFLYVLGNTAVSPYPISMQ